VADTSFDTAAESLERHTSFNRLEARGTLRIALKAAGLEPGSVTIQQLKVVFEKLMPGELETRDVSDAEAVCRTVAQEIALTSAASGTDAPADLDEVFGRLGGD
jgi:hypothetical protein